MQKYKTFSILLAHIKKKAYFCTENVKTSDKMNSNISVTLNDLSIGYRNKQGTRVVAEHLTANIHQGCLTCLLGENGVGKSTLLKTLSAFQPQLGGSICIQGRELGQYTERELARTIGIVLTEKPERAGSYYWYCVNRET